MVSYFQENGVDMKPYVTNNEFDLLAVSSVRVIQTNKPCFPYSS